jgi:hypothetical protein
MKPLPLLIGLFWIMFVVSAVFAGTYLAGLKCDADQERNYYNGFVDGKTSCSQPSHGY